MNKRTADRIEKAFARATRDNYRCEFKIASDGAEDAAVMISRDGEHYTQVGLAYNWTVDTMVNNLNDAIAQERAKREDEAQRAEADRLAQPASKRELDSFKSILGLIDYTLKQEQVVRERVAQRIADGATISSGTLDELTERSGKAVAARRAWGRVKRDESVKMTLAKLVEMTDQEIRFFNPNNSSSNAVNVMNAHEYRVWVEINQLARGIESY
ncbi:hypothetical protein FDH47_gp71 [Arthrobacter phage Brent]|uniref:Uncharacterized protein n=1 Tax=Arthrobacter phage Brent TaxID=1701798 RepID=A0A0M4RS34_9CAUD|nr:hypothetical protein FDH47_gp71 [Arthrobacter phage Brent]ALF01282.1 hypothetical protein SEA_BRENT_71 [Arthrobacter phage Brent]